MFPFQLLADKVDEAEITEDSRLLIVPQKVEEADEQDSLLLTRRSLSYAYARGEFPEKLFKDRKIPRLVMKFQKPKAIDAKSGRPIVPAAFETMIMKPIDDAESGGLIHSMERGLGALGGWDSGDKVWEGDSNDIAIDVVDDETGQTAANVGAANVDGWVRHGEEPVFIPDRLNVDDARMILTGTAPAGDFILVVKVSPAYLQQMDVMRGLEEDALPLLLADNVLLNDYTYVRRSQIGESSYSLFVNSVDQALTDLELPGMDEAYCPITLWRRVQPGSSVFAELRVDGAYGHWFNLAMYWEMARDHLDLIAYHFELPEGAGEEEGDE